MNGQLITTTSLILIPVIHLPLSLTILLVTLIHGPKEYFLPFPVTFKALPSKSSPNMLLKQTIQTTSI
jgi:hypothetical protein